LKPIKIHELEQDMVLPATNSAKREIQVDRSRLTT